MPAATGLRRDGLCRAFGMIRHRRVLAGYLLGIIVAAIIGTFLIGWGSNPERVAGSDSYQPCAPDGKPLGWTLVEVLASDNYSVLEYWMDMVNRVGMHNCYLSYCIKCGWCRFGFGKWNAQLKVRPASSLARLMLATPPAAPPAAALPSAPMPADR